MRIDLARALWLPVTLLPLLQFGCNSRSGGPHGIYEIRMATGSITVDGVVDSNEWCAAEVATPVQLTADAGGEKTTIRILRDHGSFYVAITCTDSRITARTEDFSKNDSLRVDITAGLPDTANFRRCSLAVVPQGLAAARLYQGVSPRMTESIDWSKPLDSALYKAACHTGRGEWSLELALAWSAICPLPPEASHLQFSVERRNINGDHLEVASWPYNRNIEFRVPAAPQPEQPPCGAGGSAR